MPQNFLAADVVMACCAVPAYVPPMVLRDVHGKEAFVAVDGGAFAFAPATFALSEAINRHPGRRVTLLSLGTGMVEGGYTAEDARSWGSIDWASASLPMVLRSQVRYAEEVLARTAATPDSILANYLRLSPVIPAELERALATTPELIPRLGEIGEALVEARKDEVMAILEALDPPAPTDDQG